MLVENVVDAATENVGVILDNATKKQEEQDEVEGEDEEEGEHVDEDNVDNHEDDANKFINGKCQNIWGMPNNHELIIYLSHITWLEENLWEKKNMACKIPIA